MSENTERIINGIDVSKCDFVVISPFDIKYVGCNIGYATEAIADYTYSYQCAGNPNCYYKQLLRATMQYNRVLEQNRDLQQENKRLSKLSEQPSSSKFKE